MSADFPVDLPDDAAEKLKKRKHPDWIEPMRATLVHDHFSDPGWLYERKLDGERVIAYRSGKSVRLLTRNNKDAGETYPELVDAVAKLGPDDFVIDGEVVAFEGDVTSFSRLQQRMKISKAEDARNSGVAVYYYVFDVMHLAGRDLRGLDLRSRKKVLGEAFDFADPVRFTSHRNEHGEKFLKEACRKGWEGLIAKRADQPYRGTRSKAWLKFKCSQEQSLVIGGFTEPKGSRAGFGAVLAGYYDDEGLRYAGKIGAGFDDDTLKQMRRQLDDLERKRSPFVDEVRENGAHWVQPKLVGEFSFTEWTGDGKLRHPSFLGLRRDLEPKDVGLETPKSAGG